MKKKIEIKYVDERTVKVVVGDISFVLTHEELDALLFQLGVATMELQHV